VTPGSSSNLRVLPRAPAALTIAFFLAFLGVIWFPEFNRFHVPRETISVAIAKADITQPSDAVLEEMRVHRLLNHDWQNDAQLIAAAENLLRGRAEIPGFQPLEVHLPFDPDDLERGTSLWQLQFAGLVVPEIFLDAYERTGREEFYEMARVVILAFGCYEKKAWLDRGFLWNDHAVASRVRTLADFWRVYRRRPDYRPEVAAELWGFAARTAALLAKPQQYTFATNHGVMQNLALWQICVAFPSLPRVDEYKRLAFTRLKDQIAFYVGPDGVVLEHSAEYHEFGVLLLGMVLRYATFLNLDVPPEWVSKYEAAKKFYAEIRRPDGSMPQFGDAAGRRFVAVLVGQPDQHNRIGPLTPVKMERPANSFSMYPVEGYAVLWDNLPNWPSPAQLSQTMFAWSNFPGHGHKHADEPSVLLWAGGQDWWTNVGYWPYDSPDRRRAECWEGSNAPHLADEKCGPLRTSTVLSSLKSPSLYAVEMERRGPDALVIRRLVLHLVPSAWIVVDDSKGNPDKSLETIWTTYPNVRLEPGNTPGLYNLSVDGAPERLKAYFLGRPSMTLETFRGSRTPFAGWTVPDEKPEPTGAVVTNQPADDAWGVTAWVLDDGTKKAGITPDPIRILQWNDARNWRLYLPLDSGAQVVSRQGDTILVDPQKSKTPVKIQGVLQPPPAEVANQIFQLHESFRTAAVRYPRTRDLFLYRIRASLLGVVILIFQEAYLFFHRRAGRKHSMALRALTFVAWIVLGIWVGFFYLNSSS
jgi:Heparinase II/III N-terminus/Heparinase II/III-like protein